MGMHLRNGTSIGIIDRTVPGIIALKPHSSRLEVIQFCWSLAEFGVDMFEIDRRSMSTLAKLPAGLDFIFRAENEEDLEFIEKAEIKKCIIPWQLCSETLMEQLKRNGKYIVLELEAIDDRKAAVVLGQVEQYVKYADSVRFAGLEYAASYEWLESLKKLPGDKKRIDICPSNNMSMATALAIEAVLGGVDSISAAFAGEYPNFRRGLCSIGRDSDCCGGLKST